METAKLRRFGQYARRTLLELVEARLQLVLMPESAARRENLRAVQELKKQIRATSREQVIDRVAYTWFNRFCALRYMDVNHVNRINVVSPLEGQFQPEILAEAKMGHIDEEIVFAATQAKVRALLDGTTPSPDPQQEAYRLLVVAACNFWQLTMPFLFERIADSHIEHFRPQHDPGIDPLNYANLLCSCQNRIEKGDPRHCGNLKFLGKFTFTLRNIGIFPHPVGTFTNVTYRPSG